MIDIPFVFVLNSLESPKRAKGVQETRVAGKNVCRQVDLLHLGPFVLPVVIEVRVFLEHADNIFLLISTCRTRGVRYL
jgi:hypothetical protein